MLQKLDRSVSHESFYKDFLQNDPLRLLKLCAEYGLRETQTTAAKLVRAETHNLLDPSTIIELAKQYPSSSHIIGMLGTQLIRTDILRLALLSLDDDFLKVAVGDDEFNWLICDSCHERYIENDIPPFTYYPSWLRAWGILVYNTLNTQPWDDNSFVFTTRALGHLWATTNEEFCTDCVDVARNAGEGRNFEDWAKLAKERLVDRMQKLQDLYLL